MAAVKIVKMDGEEIHVFTSAIYIFEASSGFTLELDLIVSEVAVKKYKEMENLIVEIELEDGRVFQAIMQVESLPGGLPRLHLFSEIEDPREYAGLNLVHENDAWFPNIEEGITLDEIRAVEMPIEEIRLKLNLPIDQVEWLKSQKKRVLHELFKDLIYEHWKNQNMEEK